MKFIINDKLYKIKKTKNTRHNDEFELYNEDKFLCIFYQDGRSLQDAVKSVVKYIDICQKIK